MNKVIMKKYVDEENWHEVTLQNALTHLSGHWIDGKIESMLLDEGLTLWTPDAEYKAVYKDTQS
jgi:hypothetical protein